MQQSKQSSLREPLQGQEISYSTQDIKRAVPRVNFKKIKLSKFQELYNSFNEKNIVKVLLVDDTLKINFPLKRVTEEITYTSPKASPLRKKKDEDDITFNLEAQVAQEKENIVLSPSIVPLPPLKEDFLSTSGEQPSFVWPPPPSQHEKVKSKKKKKKKPKSKKKTYFISEAKSKFPWASNEESQPTLENAFQGGLESELLGEATEKKEDIQDNINQPITEQLSSQPFFKALTPEVPFSLHSKPIENLEHENTNIFFNESNLVDYGIKLQGKANKMFDKLKNGKLSPIRIILLGGFAVTFSYLIGSYFLPSLETGQEQKQKKQKIIVRDVFKESHAYKKELETGQEKETQKNETIKKEEKASSTDNTKNIVEAEESTFKPITDKERLGLIQKAKEAIENRLDPFGQEAVLPQSKIEEKIKQREEENKPPPDIQLERKQVELVGVISTNNKNLALVNVYTADYSVSPDDDGTTRQNKLKTALGMAVPNRIEASVLDPIEEDWLVKQITKSKSRNEDPTIELVKGDKKFKLRVGQRVLLPEEDTE